MYSHLVEIQKIIKTLEAEPSETLEFHLTPKRPSNLKERVALAAAAQQQNLTPRHWAEFTGLGPLEEPLKDESVTEVLVTGPDQIWIERRGQLEKHPDAFACLQSFQNILDNLKEKCSILVTQEHPIGQGHFDQFRVQFVHRFVTGSFDHVTIRKHPQSRWSFERLISEGAWLKPQAEFMKALVADKKNFLVIGPTGSGKTSLIDACLNSLKSNERVLILEDTFELRCPNPVSGKLMTRFDPNGVLPEITTYDLLRSALRMRPDRLVIGEIRGQEAKDYLLAISTGHAGSFSSLHASQASEALLRLEMLIQMAAPQWSLMAIRRLLMLSLDGFVVLARRRQDGSNFAGYWKLSSLEENGIILEQLV